MDILIPIIRQNAKKWENKPKRGWLRTRNIISKKFSNEKVVLISILNFVFFRFTDFGFTGMFKPSLAKAALKTREP